MNAERLRRIGRETLLSVGALVGLACLLTAAAGALFGVRPLVFQSGSMAPTIHTGDLGIARTVAAADLEVGDIVTVPTSADQRVTHRVVGITGTGEERVLILKGDANEVADQRTYDVTEVDRMLFHLPRLGYVVAWLSTPVGLLVLGGVGAALVRLVLTPGRREGESPTTPGQHDDGAAAGADGDPRPEACEGEEALAEPAAEESAPGSSVARGVAATLTLALVATAAAGALAVRARPTLAAWTDAVAVNGTTVASTTVPTPTGFTCTPGSFGSREVIYTWNPVAGASSYTFHYGPSGGSSATFTGTGVRLYITGGTASGVVYVDTNVSYGSAVWTSQPTMSIPYSLGFVSSCGTPVPTAGVAGRRTTGGRLAGEPRSAVVHVEPLGG